MNISDLSNNCVWFVNRENGKVVGKMGSMGQNGGQVFGISHDRPVAPRDSTYEKQGAQ